MAHLEDLASRLAESHTVCHHVRRRPSLLDHLQDEEVLLREAYQYFARASEAQRATSYASEWLLDNYHIVQRAVRQIQEDMPAGYYRQLPKLSTQLLVPDRQLPQPGASSLEGYPRIYDLAREVIGHCESHLDLDRVTRFVQAYQKVAQLTMGELWALPTMLRMGTVARLTQTLAQITGLQVHGSADIPAISPPAPELADEVIVASCIRSLRTLATQDWKAFFESVSRVEQALRGEPASIYGRMDFETRDRYRTVVEQLALETGWDEEEVAQEAISLAREKLQSGHDSPRAGHVGFYLLDAGRPQLETRLGFHPARGVCLRRWLFSHATPVYLSAIVLLTLVALLGAAWYATTSGGTLVQLIGASALTLVPAAAAAVTLINWTITHTVPPRVLPRLGFQKGIPSECRTMVVVPALVASSSEVASLLQQLELHFLGNADRHLHFALLVDFADATQKHMPDDDALLEQLQAGIGTLNEKHTQQGTGPFYLFFRERQWNPAEDCWMGWERKRGKLVEFNRLLTKGETSFSLQMGDLDILPEIQYVITLDADTSLPRDSARRLVATLAHPLNRAEFDPRSDAVIAGYTVLQPRVEIRPVSASRTLFTRVFSGDTGVDLYTLAVSDVYQDFFGEGSYVGKGIYDVVAFERCLAGRVPENALLSHDLFEGIHGRAGLVTDVVLFEDYPPRYLAYAHRLHRWVRGDWQLLPWLLPGVPHAGEGKIPNGLSVLGRWKILDNLRRSLLAPALLALLIAGWWWLPGSAMVWTLAALAMYVTPLATSGVAALAQRLRGTSLRVAAPSLWLGTCRCLLSLTFLVYETLLMVDAIASTLVRLVVTRRRLLQWTTAAHTVPFVSQEKLTLNWRRMTGALLLALGLAFLVGISKPATLPVAAPLLLAWLVSPWIAEWIGRPVVHKLTPLSGPEQQQLRRLARRTWLYFERFVGPDDHWLPPDHFQEDPRGLVAHRTSPTNLGLLLVSTLSAYDLGYIGLVELMLRLRNTLENMGRLERYRGHFLNWYDTHSLEPLPPRYVSTVDSGNLAACLLALRQGLRPLLHEPLLRWQRWQGLLDTLGVLAETVEGLEGGAPLEAHLADIRQQVLAVRDDPRSWATLLGSLCDDGLQQLDQRLMSLTEASSHDLGAKTLHSLRIWSERVHHHLLDMQRKLALLLPWLLPLSQPPALFTQAETDPSLRDACQRLQDLLSAIPELNRAPEVCRAARSELNRLQDLLADGMGPAPDRRRRRLLEEARVWCMGLADGLDSAQIAAENALNDLQDVGAPAEAYSQAMAFSFLFDSNRQVFYLGYDVGGEKADSNHYDLLASEARIASLVAIAKGEVPQSHWLHLARPVTRIDHTQALLSWNGSMFEYLMPSLLMRRYEGTLLDQSQRAIVQRQIEYGRQKGVPWGISEAGYYGFDAHLNYQYRGFGVPGLGFKRGLGEDLVVSPYASLLALPLDPRAVMQNIAHLTRLHMLGPYGFYEAIDYTPSRMSLGQESGMVRSYMAHHQGMILLSLASYLEGEAMIRRFHADPRVQSVELLLQERVPQQVPVEVPHPEDVGALSSIQPRTTPGRWSAPVDTPLPYVHFLSNGRYGALLTSAGGGYSRWQEIDLTRWRGDTTLDNWGTWLYVQDGETGALWSVGIQPTGSPPESQQVLFFPHKVEFQRLDHDISLRMEVTVSPRDDVEIRLITLTSHSDHPRRLMLTSYGEIVLTSHAADRRHPAFNKLFVESEYLPDVNGLLFHRRQRSAGEMPIYLGHLLVVEGERKTTGAHETDRGRFLGRGRTPRAPASLCDRGSPRLSGATGATLDPIMALGQEIDLEPHATAQVAYVTLVAKSRPEALGLAHRYQAFHLIHRAFDQSQSAAELELHHLDLTVPEVECFQQLLSVLLYPHLALRADASTLTANQKGQSGLWPYAISGDYPILLVRIGSVDETALVSELLRAHAYWRRRHIKVDLVILNLQDISYSQELHSRLHQMVARTGGDAWLNRRGGIFLVRADQMSAADWVLLETAARAILDGTEGRLSDQLGPLRERPVRLPAFVATLSPPAQEELTSPVNRPHDLVFDNGLGGFTAGGREYVIYLKHGPGTWPESLEGPVEGSGERPVQGTPAPWINVIANPEFGFLISEAGSGYTWAGNSGENRLTPWRNDPVTDLPGEALYLRDEEVGHFWSPTPLPAGAPAPYLIRHGAGYSVFEHNSHGLKQRLRVFAVPDAPVKVLQLRLENRWNRNRRITATFYAEWVLGTTRDVDQQYIVSEFDATRNALLARNPYNEEFGDRFAFLSASREPHGLTADRTEFLGREGSLSRPAALDRMALAGTVKAGLDPCAAYQVHIWLAPGEAEEVFFLLGQGADRKEAVRLVKRYQDPVQVGAAWDDLNRFWDDHLGAVKVRTPDPAMDLLLNRWLLYQVLSCRLWGRSALYQSSGAFGYRDQLQDVMSLTLAAPGLARDHILEAARHQFEAGDVLHWWHPPSGRGVRTRCSDDLLWLPFVTAHYVTTTGDETILAADVPFLAGDPLDSEEEERYGTYEPAVHGGTLYEHCRRALDKGLTAGAHSLPLIGSGDWNDGMNRVGIKGRGESVWLGWFLYAALARFAAICELMDDDGQATAYRQRARKLRQALKASAWDGNWYRRAYYDDGTALGSAKDGECQIDSIAQSWAVLSKAGDPARTARAMHAVTDRLVRQEDELVLLFTPPFDETTQDPGYVKAYPPGIRENGGQYTHAAVWAAWAFAELGEGDRAGALFRLLNPIFHGDTHERMARYGVEPYVVAADLYSVPPHTGRGGWTWYTGSAGWMYRLGVEAILGLHREGKALRITPCIQRDWPGYELAYRDGGNQYQIRVENPHGANRGVKQITLDGKILSAEEIPLLDDGRQHEVHVLMGGRDTL